MPNSEKIRLEIIANQSVELEVKTILEEAGCSGYTFIAEATGKGYSGIKEGSAVWPELNFMVILWETLEIIVAVEQNLDALRAKFVAAGIAYFR